MLEDKIFLEKEITPNVARLTKEVRILIDARVPIQKIYNYILTHARDHREMYITLFLFGLSYRWYKDDNNLK